NESGQTLSFNVTNNNNSLFSVQPTVAAMENGKLTYTPAANANGSATVTVSLSDNDGATSATQTFTITVNAVNDIPLASNGTVTIDEDDTQSITMVANDADGAGLTYIIVSNPTHGSLSSLNVTAGTVTYAPDLNFNGSDSFTFKVNDGVVDSNTATTTINITAVNDAPSITLNSPNGTEIWAGGSSHNITWSASDVDTGQTLLVNLDYTTDDGAIYTNIVENFSNLGTYSWTVPTTINSSTVKIRALAIDDAAPSAAGTDLSNDNFTIDSTAPTAPSTPSSGPNPTKSTNPTWSWDAVTTDLSGIAEYIWRVFDGTTYVDDGTTPGNVLSATTNLVQGIYSFFVKATDNAGNTGDESSAGSLTVDTSAPTVIVNQKSGQADPTKNSPINFTAVFSEAVTGFDETDVTIAGNGTPVAVVTTSDNITFNIAVSGMTDSAVTASIPMNKAIDIAGNNNGASTSTDNTVTYDTTPPTGTIVINGGAAYTNAISHEVTLTLSAGADLSGVVEMNIANSSSYAGWETYSTSKLWTLSAGDGTKTVRVKFKDAAGNETATGIPTTITVDTVKPVITLNGVTPNIEVGGTYEELGATADDGSTVSITGSVNTVVVDSYTITYNATDVAGNHAIPVTRTVNVVDTTDPVITVLGDNPITVEINSDYEDAGAMATDNYDEDISNEVIVDDSEVDTEEVGTYTVYYDVDDSNGNSAERKTRTVNVVDSIDAVFNGISDDLATAGIASNMSDVTTDNIQSFPGLYFEKSITVDEITTKMGKITFNSELDLSSEATQEFLQNLGTKMNMAEAGIISLDFRGTTSDLSLKDVSATIEFYGLDALGFTADSTSDEVNSKLIAYDDDGNILDKTDLVDDPGTYTPPVGVCEVGGACYIFSVDVNHFTKYKIDEVTQTTPNIDGDATLSGETTEVVLTDPDQPVD
ncbi:MAG: DUF5011 domain-containing protein, partial [bacterium]|nr:DUF5011 domain-containing protein [bacterium]